jgi:hypothetical protein
MVYDFICENCGYIEEVNVSYEERLTIEVPCPKCDTLLKYTVPCPKVCEASIPDNVAHGRFNGIRARRVLEKAKRKAKKKRDKSELKKIQTEISKL